MQPEVSSPRQKLKIPFTKSNGAVQRPATLLAAQVLVALVPAVCVLWFMTAAMRNERLAVHPRLAEVYRDSRRADLGRHRDDPIPRLSEDCPVFLWHVGGPGRRREFAGGDDTPRKQEACGLENLPTHQSSYPRFG